MPRNYSNGKIYRLLCNVTGDNYYGSTTQPLYKRKHGHIKDYILYTEGESNTITRSYDINKKMILILYSLKNTLVRIKSNQKDVKDTILKIINVSTRQSQQELDKNIEQLPRNIYKNTVKITGQLIKRQLIVNDQLKQYVNVGYLVVKNITVDIVKANNT